MTDESRTTVPWVRYCLLATAMFGSIALADVVVGMWLGWIIAVPAGAIAVKVCMTDRDPQTTRCFKAEDRFEIKDRGVVWTGRSPVAWNKDDLDDRRRAWAGQWTIDHPAADPARRYEVVAIESHCVPRIRMGAPVGIMVREIDNANLEA